MRYHYFTLEQRDNLARAIDAIGPDGELLRERLHSPDYGVCRSCGADIPYVRLLEAPAAKLCAACG